MKGGISWLECLSLILYPSFAVLNFNPAYAREIEINVLQPKEEYQELMLVSIQSQVCEIR